MTPKRLLFPGIFTAVSLIILAALGAWQWQRRAEKTALLQTIESRIHSAPVPAPAASLWSGYDASGSAYTRVEATGVFDHAKEAHVFFSLATQRGGVAGPGYLILTPFQLAAGGTIIVNRGFVPTEKKLPATRQAGQTPGQITITGLLRPAEQRGGFSGADDPVKNVFYVRDPATIARALALGTVAPFIIDQSLPVPYGGLPLPGITQIDIPNNHLQYALTWWSLGLILAIIFLLYARGQMR